MKRRPFTEEQIVFALRLAESGTSVAKVCRKRDSDATFYNLAQEVRGPGCAGVTPSARVGSGEQRLKQLVADLTLDKHMLPMFQKKFFAYVMDFQISERHGCRSCCKCPRSTQRYRSCRG